MSVPDRITLDTRPNIHIDAMQLGLPIGKDVAEAMDEGLTGPQALRQALQVNNIVPQQVGLDIDLEDSVLSNLAEEDAWTRSHRPDGRLR